MDQGQRNTGLCLVDCDGAFVEAVTLKPGRTMKGGQRLAFIRDGLLEWMRRPGLVRAACEGYAYFKSLRAHDMGEVGGLARLCAFDAGIELIIVSPAEVISAATGRTQAEPEQMIAAARQRGAVVDDDHQADAFFLARAARAANVSPVSISAPRKRPMKTIRPSSP